MVSGLPLPQSDEFYAVDVYMYVRMCKDICISKYLSIRINICIYIYISCPNALNSSISLLSHKKDQKPVFAQFHPM